MFRATKVHVILLILLAGGVYANSLGGDFVYDDKAMIVAYDLVKDIKNVPAAFVSATSIYGNVNYYRPLQTISYMADYFLWGGWPAGFHLTNVLFHIASVLMVYFFIRLLFRNKILAFITALMFSTHPVHSTVVAYIAGRADAMLCAFMLASFILYIKFHYGPRKMICYILSIFFFALALMTKEFAMIIPVAVILFDKYANRWTPLRETKKTNSDYLPFIVILAGYILFRITSMSFFVEGSVPPFPFKNRFITAPYVVAQYLRLIVLPNDLHIGRVPWVANSFANGRILISLIVVAVISFAAYRMRNREKTVWFGACWFMLMIFPSLNIITPLFYTIAENWLYIPSIGLFLVIAALLKKAYEKLAGTSFAGAKYVVVICAAFFVCALGAITVSHNKAWKDEISLGKNTLRFNPKEFKVYNNLGVVYLGRGELDLAEESFRECLRIKPDTGMAYFNLYRVYMARGQRGEAIQYLDKARQLDPHRVNILVEKMGIRN